MKNPSLSSKIILGLLLGVAAGLIFGEHIAWTAIGGDIFVGLLQMTVLPYIMFSLIVNIGRLSMKSGRIIIKNGLLFLCLLLSFGLIGLFLLPFAFPDWESGQFYSSDFIQSPQSFDFVKLYIPANPFESLSNNVVPAVVLFSIFIGLGLMHVPGREDLLKPLDVLSKSLNQVNKMIIKLTPIGVFFIASGVTASIRISELSKLQGYLMLYTAAVIILTFVILPYLISVFTPISPRTVFRICKSSLITIFATGKIIVVYPQLIENIKEILQEEGYSNEESKSEVDIIMPLAYPFPNLGTFMIFIFIPFAAWYSGKELFFTDYPVFLSSTLLSSFVSPITGLPYSMDLMEIKKDSFHLFIVSTVITDRLRVLLGAFHLITLTLLTIAASQRFLTFKKGKAVKGLVVISILSFVSIFGMKYLLEKSLERIPSNYEIVNSFELISPIQEHQVSEIARKNPVKKRRGENTLSRIKRSGKLRVGFYKNAIPFTFWNADSLLVGYGIDLAHMLAKDLEAEIDFVPIDDGKLIEELNTDYFDIVMSDIFLSSSYAEKMQLSSPYMNVSLALLVHESKTKFSNFSNAIALDTFTVGYFQRKEIVEEFLSFFPNAGSYGISHLEEFFEQDELDSISMDAYLTSAERAAALTILHSEYKVVNPLPYHINNSLVFPLANDEVWRRYIDKWIEFRSQDGSFSRVYDQWILGKPFKKPDPRWNLYDDLKNKN